MGVIKRKINVLVIPSDALNQRVRGREGLDGLESVYEGFRGAVMWKARKRQLRTMGFSICQAQGQRRVVMMQPFAAIHCITSLGQSRLSLFSHKCLGLYSWRVLPLSRTPTGGAL